MADWIEQLERLTRLHKDGALTDQEFAEQKVRLMEVADDAPEPVYAPQPTSGANPLWLIAGVVIAALLGVLAWTWLVDRNGAVVPQDDPAKTAASSAPAASASAAPAATETASAMLAASDAASAAPESPVAIARPARQTFNPSFRCAGQTGNVLVMICEDRTLSAKDRDLSDLFRSILADSDPAERDKLLLRQRGFLRERDQCVDRSCLNEWYDRMTEFYAND